ESVLALDDSALDVDQVDNLIKICPTKEEMNIIMGKLTFDTVHDFMAAFCVSLQQFFMELMRVPRAESKLRVFSFKLKFNAQVSEVRESLNIINLSAEQASYLLSTVMKTVLSLGNALNQGTHRGDATGFRLDSLLKLPDSNDHRMSLMNYLCKALADKQPELLNFSKDLGSLQLMHASKLIVRSLEGDMHAIQTGLNYVVSEKKKAKKDGPVSRNFR
nr:hypothetical protein [Tanacetum cinerariifolium]